MKLFVLLSILCMALSSTLCNGKLMKLVILSDAPQTHGARCLDGSPPGFYFRRGFGSGRSKWIIHLQGGAACRNEIECAARSQMFLGSTDGFTQMPASSTREAGIMSDVRSYNPKFYNWNMANVFYCDGGIYAGYREEPLVVNGTTLYFRGFRNLQAVMDALMTIGMRRATDVILTGCSAGALATYIHADYVRSLLPPGVKYAVMADAGIFVDDAGAGRRDIQSIFNLHNLTGGMDEDCIRQYQPLNEEWRCAYAQYILPHITSGVFALNSIHDSAQPELVFRECLTLNCNDGDLPEVLAPLREAFFNVTTEFISRDDVGVYFDSCLRHCQSIDDSWFRGIRVEGQLPRETFANWYFESGADDTKVVDCEEYLCNESCGPPRNAFGAESN